MVQTQIIIIVHKETSESKVAEDAYNILRNYTVVQEGKKHCAHNYSNQQKTTYRVCFVSLIHITLGFCK